MLLLTTFAENAKKRAFFLPAKPAVPGFRDF
nr:MAG TPA_asm: hypothetical protein [Caudoviricetes sp.]DAQ36648.1 MAG TPA: hypothetical protein [Caudoviricetes sp.]